MKLIVLIFLFSLNIQANDSYFDGTQPMTEQEEAESEIYIHQGMAQEKYQELCANEDGTVKEECINTETGFKTGSNMQKLEAMMPMVSQAYSMITGMSSTLDYNQKKNGVVQTETVTKTKKNGEVKTKEKNVTEEGKDYCAMIPMVTDTAANFYQSTMNQQTEANIQNTAGTETQQAASFYAMAKVHKDRAKSAQVQMAGYGSTSACYAALMATNTVSGNFGTYAKTGAALLLTTFYALKQKAHKERAEMLETMAKEFPQAGDCNPHTNTTCFCNEESSIASDPTNYQKYCVPSSFHSAKTDSFVCMTKDMKPDPKCNCKSTGSCINAKFATVGAQIGLDPSVMNNPLSGLSPLSSGFGTGGLQGITDKNTAFAKKTLKDLEKTDIPDISLTPKQKAMAKNLANAGLPKFVAASLAKSNGSGSVPSSLAGGAMGTGSTLSSSPLRKAMASVQKAKFSRGGNAPTAKTKSNSPTSPFSAFGRKSRSSGANKIEILDFAEKAAREAEISKDTSRPIFDIITYRYKASAWREFKDTIRKEAELEEVNK